MIARLRLRCAGFTASPASSIYPYDTSCPIVNYSLHSSISDCKDPATIAFHVSLILAEAKYLENLGILNLNS
jgi:hypothetical protein